MLTSEGLWLLDERRPGRPHQVRALWSTYNPFEFIDGVMELTIYLAGQKWQVALRDADEARSMAKQINELLGPKVRDLAPNDLPADVLERGPLSASRTDIVSTVVPWVGIALMAALYLR